MTDEQRKRLKAAIELLKREEGTEALYQMIGQMVISLTTEKGAK